MGSEEVKVYRTWSSPFPLRVMWALKLKGVHFETVFEDLTNKSSALLELNPVHKKVPVLLHNGKPLSESLVILEYVDETWNHNPLLPRDPHGRARARFWAKFGDDKVLPSVWNAFVKHGKEQEEAKAKAIENLKLLEEQLEGKKLFGGDEIGFVDIALGWLANYLTVFEDIIGLTLIDPQELPLLSAWRATFAELPVIAGTWPDKDRLVAKFRALREPTLKKD